MKILFMVEHYHPYPGGAERFFQLLAESLVHENNEVTVLTTKHSPSLASEETLNGVRIRRVRCWNRYLLPLAGIYAGLKEAQSCEVIHTGPYGAALLAYFCSKLVRKPVVITFHEVWGSLWTKLPTLQAPLQKAFGLFERFLLRLPFTHFVAISRFTLDRLIQNGVPEKKASLIYCGLDYSEFEAVRHRPPRLFTYMYFGRLGHSKALFELLRGAALFREKEPQSKLVLIIPREPASLFRSLCALILELGLEDYVEMRSSCPREELVNLISISSCVIIPSFSEGFCYAAAEASAIGVPIVSSGRGALLEVVSGRHITIKKISAEGIAEALTAAKREEWAQIVPRSFPQSNTTRLYLEIYSTFADARIASEDKLSESRSERKVRLG